MGRIITKYSKSRIQVSTTYVKYIKHDPHNRSKQDQEKEDFLPWRKISGNMLFYFLKRAFSSIINPGQKKPHCRQYQKIGCKKRFLHSSTCTKQPCSYVYRPGKKQYPAPESSGKCDPTGSNFFFFYSLFW